MVRALLAGTKTQTRRLVTKGTSDCGSAMWSWLRFDEAYPWGGVLFVPGDHPDFPGDGAVHRVHPRWQAGERLWVRETFAHVDDHREHGPHCVDYRAYVRTDYAAARVCGPWRPSIFMPRWASRIDLDVEAVRAERLQAITRGDARAEGIGTCGPAGYCSCDVDRYARLWDEINGSRATWASNPWVWVITFRREVP